MPDYADARRLLYEMVSDLRGHPSLWMPRRRSNEEPANFKGSFGGGGIVPPDAIPCAIRDKLIQLYAEATMEHRRLKAARTTAVLEGKETPSAEGLAESQMRKENARYALLQHMDEHGCGGIGHLSSMKP